MTRGNSTMHFQLHDIGSITQTFRDEVLGVMTGWTDQVSSGFSSEFLDSVFDDLESYMLQAERLLEALENAEGQL